MSLSASAALLALTIAAPIARADDGGCDPDRFWRRCEVSKPVPGSSPDSIVLRFEGEGTTRTFALVSVPLQNAAASLRQRKAAVVEVGDLKGAKAVIGLGVRIGPGLRLAVMLGLAVALLALAGRLISGGPSSLALGEDGPYSSSRWQMLVWFTVLVVAYGATIVLRWWAGGIAYAGGVGIPAKLLILSGLSALTFAAARTIRQLKENRAAARKPAPATPDGREPERSPRPRPRFPADLIRDGSDPPDLARFQMVVVTILAVAVYIIRVFGCLGRVELVAATSLPDVDTALLGGLAISQGAYLARKSMALLERG